MNIKIPKVGDMADHRSRQLDPRPVSEVNPHQTHLRLMIGDLLTDWLPVDNYTFTRPKGSQ